MQIKLLGHMELLSNDGTQLEIGPLKRRVVLAVLALAGGRPTSPDRLIQSVWGDSPPATALHTLHGLVSQLRVNLGPEAIESHAAGYRLNGALVTVDVDRFQEMLADGDETDAPLALWTGEPLEGLGDSDAIVAERQRLREMRLGAVETWCDRRLAVGDDSAVIVRIGTELPTSPFREALWERLMLAQYRAHRQADALATYQRVRRLLGEQLGIDPGTALKRLEHQILQQDPALERVAADVTPTRRGRVPFTAFAGRAAELEHLRRRLPDATGFVTLVVGEPGIGKSRLVRELADDAERQDICVLWGTAANGPWASPYLPFVEALSTHLASLGHDRARAVVEPFAAQLGAVVPLIGQLFPDLRNTLVDEPDARQFEIFDAVSRLLTAIASTRRVMLVLDDLHWADRSTIALLSFIVGLTATAPISIFATYRDTDVDDRHPLVSALATARRVVQLERVRLSGLTEAAGRELVRALAGESSTDEFARRLIAESGGNPFYLTELIRAGHDPSSGSLPDSINDTVRSRLADLSADTNRLLRVASLFDEWFPMEATRLVAGLGDDAALDAIDEGLRAHMIEPTDRHDQYLFAHALARVAIRSTINPSRLPRLHRSIATTLSELATSPMMLDDHARIAAHYHASRSLPGADLGVAHALAAADSAGEIAAHSERADLLAMAVDLMDDADDRRLDVLRQRAVSLARANRPEEATDAALTIIGEFAERRGRLEACRFFGDLILEFSSGFELPTDEAFITFCTIGEELGEPDRPIEWTYLRMCRRMREANATGFADYRPRAELYADEEFRTLVATMMRSAHPDRSKAAPFAFATHAEAVATDTADGHWLEGYTGDYPAIVAQLTMQAEELARRQRTAPSIDRLCMVAAAQCVMGDLDEARRLLRTIESSRTQASSFKSVMQSLQAAHAVLYGITDGPWDDYIAVTTALVDAEVAAMKRQFDRHQMPVIERLEFAPWSIATRARVHARRGRFERAVALVDRTVPYLSGGPVNDEQFSLAAHSSAEVLWLADDTTLLDSVEGAVRDRWLPCDFRYFGSDVRLTLARLCALTGRVDEATEWFDQARGVFRVQRATPMLAIADHDEAWMHLRAGGAASATHVERLLARARAVFVEIGMPGWIERTDRLAVGHLGRSTVVTSDA